MIIAQVLIETLVAVLENENVDISSLTLKIQDSKHSYKFKDLMKLADEEIEKISLDSSRLDFMLEQRIRVEKWNTNPSTELYFVMNEDDESIAKNKNGRMALDEAIKFLQDENND